MYYICYECSRTGPGRCRICNSELQIAVRHDQYTEKIRLLSEGMKHKIEVSETEMKIYWGKKVIILPIKELIPDRSTIIGRIVKIDE